MLFGAGCYIRQEILTLSKLRVQGLIGLNKSIGYRVGSVNNLRDLDLVSISEVILAQPQLFSKKSTLITKVFLKIHDYFWIA